VTPPLSEDDNPLELVNESQP